MLTENVLNGADVINRGPDSVYVRIPRAMQVVIAGGCSCDYCKAHPELVPTWDTLAIPVVKTRQYSDTVFTVHMPNPLSVKWTDTILSNYAH